MAYLTCTSNTSSTVVVDVWPSWINNCTSTTTASTVWITWVGTSTTCVTATNYVNPMLIPQAAPRQPTEAELAAMQGRQAEAAAQEQERKVAHAKAMELLRANLSQAQRAALDKHGWFLVEGGKSKKSYRVHGNGYAGNIHELDKAGKAVARYCVHAEYRIPLGDQLLAQAISLRLDEEHIIGRANRTPLAA